MTGIILAGGKSTRMGQDKASMPWVTTDLLYTIVLKLQIVCSDIIVVSNTPRHFNENNVRLVSDIYQNIGPLGGIHAGLLHAKNDLAFVTACDMPYLVPAAVEYLFSKAHGWDITIPLRGEYFEPMFACYSKSCIPVAEMLFRKNIRQVTALFDFLQLNFINEADFLLFSPTLDIFNNINTLEDYNKARNHGAV